MTLCRIEDVEKYNEEKIKRLQSEVERLEKITENCEIKHPIINNGYDICPNELECLRVDGARMTNEEARKQLDNIRWELATQLQDQEENWEITKAEKTRKKLEAVKMAIKSLH